MKKIRNLVIGGIENKIFNLVLVTIVLIVAAYTIVISYQANSLHHLVEKTNAQQKESISEISKTTMDAVFHLNPLLFRSLDMRHTGKCFRAR